MEFYVGIAVAFLQFQKRRCVGWPVGCDTTRKDHYSEFVIERAEDLRQTQSEAILTT